MKLSIERSHLLNNPNSKVVGFFDIKMDLDNGLSVIIKSCKLVNHDDGQFVSMPNHEKGGKWYSDVTISRPLQEAFTELIAKSLLEATKSTDTAETKDIE